MDFHPFPETVAPFVERIRADYQAGVAAGRKHGHERRETDWPAYRMADGTVRLAHDLYRPKYPEGATPGLSDCVLVKQYGPAGHYDGWRTFPDNFRPL